MAILLLKSQAVKYIWLTKHITGLMKAPPPYNGANLIPKRKKNVPLQTQTDSNRTIDQRQLRPKEQLLTQHTGVQRLRQLHRCTGEHT